MKEITIIMIASSLLLVSLSNIHQTLEMNRLKMQVACLEHGGIYAVAEFCIKKN